MTEDTAPEAPPFNEDTCPHYPTVEVELLGAKGDPKAIVRAVTAAMGRAGVPAEHAAAYRLDAADSTDDAMRATMAWIQVV